MTLAEIRARLRELEARATPGPWLVEVRNGKTRVMVGQRDELILQGSSLSMAGFRPADAALIAESRNHLAALLDALDEAQLALEIAVNAESDSVGWHGVANAALARLRGGKG